MELIVPEDLDPALLAAALAPFDTPPTRRLLSPYAFDPEAARRELGRALGTLFLDGFGLEDHALGVAAAGAILRYLQDSHTPDLPHLDRLLPYTPGRLPGAGRSHPAAPGDLRDLAQPLPPGLAPGGPGRAPSPPWGPGGWPAGCAIP